MDDPINTIFGENPPNLYTVLGLKQDDKPSTFDIKKSYHKLALQHHPDKDPSADASERFQKVSFAYAVLSDEGKRSKYDKTGRTSDLGIEINEDFTWDDYFNEQFERVTWEALAEDRKRYQGSEDERNDLKRAYEECDGDLDQIFSQIPHSSILDDEDRFIDIIKAEIDKGALPKKKKFDKSITGVARKSRTKKAEKEADEAEQLRRELELGSDFEEVEGDDEDDSALAKLISARGDKRQAELDGLVSALEEKYAKPKKNKGKGKEVTNIKKRIASESEEEEPTEEEFQKAQENLKKPSRSSKSSKSKKQKS